MPYAPAAGPPPPGLRVAADPLTAAGEVVGFARSLRRLVTTPAAPPSPALRRRGTRRRLLVHEVGVEELKRAGRAAAGGTLNDAYLAGVLGALRRYHEAIGVPLEHSPMAVPVYGRSGGPTGLAAAEHAPGGNHFSAIRFAGPVGEADPAVRIRTLGALVAAGREEPALAATDVLARVFARTPEVLLAEISRQQGQLDVQASNVAGFPSSVYLAGAAVQSMYAFGPAPGVAAMFLLVSYNGTCGIGVTLDELAFTAAELFAGCVAAGFDEVLALDPQRSRPRVERRAAHPAHAPD